MPLPLAPLALPLLSTVARTVATRAIVSSASRAIVPSASRAIVPYVGGSTAVARTGSGFGMSNIAAYLSKNPLTSRLMTNPLAKSLTKGLPYAAGAYALTSMLSRGGSFLKNATKIGLGAALGGILGRLGRGDDDTGGEVYRPLSEPMNLNGDSTALRAGLPTLKNPSIPSLPTFRAKKKEGECCGDECCEVTNRLLSIAVKYLAGIDATVKNQLEVERASFVQERQATRETTLEQEKQDGGVGSRALTSVVSSMKRANDGIMSFFGKTLMKTLILSLPLVVKSLHDEYVKPITEMVEKVNNLTKKVLTFLGFEEEPAEVVPQNGVTAVSPGPTTRPSTGVLSVRNNNPGNLRFANQRGAIGKDKNGFAIFPTPEAGMEAMRRQIAKDTQERGLTLENFIKKYAPPSENPTSEYVKNVSAKTGIAPNAKVPADKMSDVMRAMVLQEGGEQAIQYFYNNQAPTSGQMVAQQTSGSAAKISEAAVDRAARESGVATTPASVVVAQNAPPPSSTTVTSNGPADPSSPYFPGTMMDLVKYHYA